MTLSINFTDPEGVSGMFTQIIQPYIAPLNITFRGGGADVIVGEPVWSDKPYLVVSRMSYHIPSIPARVPTPPLGRLLIATFPSIYTARSQGSGRIASPRIFPPLSRY